MVLGGEIVAGFGGAIRLEGESEYRRALQQINQSLKENASELRLVASSYDDNDRSLRTLSAKTNDLTDIYNSQNKSLDSLKSIYAQMSAEMQTQVNNHNNLVKTYEAEKQKLDEIERTAGNTTKEYKDQADKVLALSNQVAQSNRNLDENEKSMSKVRTQMNEAQSAINKTTQELEDLGKEASQSGKEAEDASKGGWTVFKGIMADLASKAIQSVISGLKQLGSAFVDVGKQALSSYSDYEQLAGGAQKIFNEMDFAQISKDAQEAYLNMGLSANDYLKVMTSVGANFASTLGDAKGYAVAKEGMQAITDFATGTGKSIDELSHKYQMITKSTSSYQSIADQFAGILPATSAGFLETAQQAGFLSDKYKKLTEVPMAEYQEALTKMLTKGVDAIGLTGNTVAEAYNTISGSVGMMKASWQNLLTGLADNNADFEMLVDNFMNTLVTPDGQGGVLGQIVPKIEKIVSSASTVIQRILPQLLQMVVPIIQNNLPVILSAVQSALTSILALLPTIMPTIQALIPDIVKSLVNDLPMIVDTGLKLIVSLINGINDAMPQLINKIPEIVTTIEKTIIKNLPAILEAGIKLVAYMIAGIYQAGAGLVQPAVELVMKVSSAIGSKISEMISAGKNLVAGIWEGISGAYTWITNKIRGWVGNVTSFIKRLFGIASPSKLFREEIGENLALGIGEGFADEMDDVSKIMADSIPTSFDLDSPKVSGARYGYDSLDMISAFKEALSQMKIELDDDEVGRFVENTVARAIYA